MLWKMDFIVDGKHLETVLAGISGYALNLQPPRVVTNGIARQGVVQQKSEGTSQVAQLEAQLAGHRSGDLIRSSNIRDIMESLSISKNNYSSLLTTMKKRNFLTTTDKRGVLKIL
jgi:hypothetical protein